MKTLQSFKARTGEPLGVPLPAATPEQVDAAAVAAHAAFAGWSASAGTLNPHRPKQVIGASQIERWADPGLGG